jgi:hypothetical protein
MAVLVGGCGKRAVPLWCVELCPHLIRVCVCYRLDTRAGGKVPHAQGVVGGARHQLSKRGGGAVSDAKVWGVAAVQEGLFTGRTKEDD